MSNSTVVYPEYSPSWLVENFHALPHENFESQQISHSFNITATTDWKNMWEDEYIQAVVRLPASIFLWCFLFMILFFISLCCRMCSKSGCVPQFDTEKITDPKLLQRFYDTVTRLMRIFVSLVAIIVVADNFIFLGSHNLDKGSSIGQDALDYFSDTFVDMTVTGGSLQVEGVLIQDDITDAAADTCPDAGSMLPYVAQFNSNMESYVDLVSPMADKVDGYHETLTNYAVRGKNGIVFGYWAIVLLMVTSFVAAVWKQSKFALKCNIVWVSSILLVLWALCACEMTTLMTLSDFCISPTEFAIGLLPQGNTQDIVSYYSTCTGTDPTAEYVAAATGAIRAMNETTVALLGNQCQGNTDLELVLGNLTVSQSLIDEVVALGQCEPSYNQVNDLLHNAVCFQLFTGFYIMWVCQYVISLGVFCLLVVSCIIYQYFGTYWGLKQEDVDKMIGNPAELLLSPEVGTSTGTNTGTRNSRHSRGRGDSEGLRVQAPVRATPASTTLMPNNTYATPIINYDLPATESSE